MAHLTLTPPAGSSPREFTLNYNAILHQVASHSALVSVREDWSGVLRMSPVDNSIAPLKVSLGEGSLWRGFKSMFALGLSHIREGTDHLLFLLTLLLPAPLLVVAGR